MSAAHIRPHIRRRVFYIPGYDPRPPRHYREIYRREGAAQAAINGYHLTSAPREDKTGPGWGVAGTFAEGTSHVEFEVLVWSDLVRSSMDRGIWASYAQLARTAWIYIRSGVLRRMMKLRRGPVLAALYPVAMMLAYLAIALGAGLLVWWRLTLWAGAAAAALPAIAVFLGLMHATKRLDRKLFAYYLMQDFAYAAGRWGAPPPELDARLDAFAARIAATLADWDEVLVVGHSSGAHMGVSVLAKLLDRDLPLARIGFLTLGHVTPMVALLPEAGGLRRDLARMGTQTPITWVDVTAPGDACCFALCDPVTVACGDTLERPQTGPLIISAAFRQTLSEAQKKALKGHWFRLHFQYLYAFDHPGRYDYFAITAGPRTLAQQFDKAHHSPGRIHHCPR